MFHRLTQLRRAIAVLAIFVAIGGAVGVGLKLTLSDSAQAAGSAKVMLGDSKLADRLMQSWWDCSIRHGSKFLDPDGDGEGGLVEPDESKAACTSLYMAGAAASNADTLPLAKFFQAIGEKPAAFWACLNDGVANVGLNASAEFRSAMSACAAQAGVTLPVATG